jgi:hypothetical protein
MLVGSSARLWDLPSSHTGFNRTREGADPAPFRTVSSELPSRQFDAARYFDEKTEPKPFVAVPRFHRLQGEGGATNYWKIVWHIAILNRESAAHRTGSEFLAHPIQ